MKENKDYKIEYITSTSEDFEFLYGNETGVWINDEIPIEDSNYVIKTEKLSIEQIIERFGDLLSEKDIENIRNMNYNGKSK